MAHLSFKSWLETLGQPAVSTEPQNMKDPAHLKDVKIADTVKKNISKIDTTKPGGPEQTNQEIEKGMQMMGTPDGVTNMAALKQSFAQEGISKMKKGSKKKKMKNHLKNLENTKKESQ